MFATTVVGFTIVVGRVTDKVIIPGLDDPGSISGRGIWAAMAMIAVVGLIRGLSVMVRRFFNFMGAMLTQRTWRLSIVDRYLDAPLDFFRSRPAGELLAHVDADIEAASSMLMPLAFAVTVVVLIVLAMVSLLVVHPLFALIALLLFPALAVINQIYTRAVEAPAARAQAMVGEVSSVAHESLEGVLVVKTLGRESDEVERLTVASEQLRSERLKVGAIRARFEPILYSLPGLGVLVLLLIGVWLVGRNAVTVGEVVQAMTLFGILWLPVQILGFLFQEMPRSVVAMDRIDSVLRVEPERRPDPEPALVAVPDSVGVVLEGVSFAYPDGTTVLDDLSLRIEAGEVVALVGATGCGKSTIVGLMSGMMPPDRGRIVIGGADVSDLGPDGVAQLVAPVLQETFMFADTLRANLALDAEVSEGELNRVLSLVAADRFVSELSDGPDTVMGERGVTLSGGQRQRLAIARALLRRPRLLLLDDATSAVDPVVEAAILENLQAHSGRTLMVVAHRLATIRLADRVLFMDGGRIAADGTHEELLTLPGYSALARAYEEATR
ncbi:MAG: ABC transporter ATP-binding protein [Acidimicrobiales bacterium]|jgi:ABC-type multidrug transport system fused ATPase/permease subunit|nr:ABC transporter ATP-binding protein [Acidimicrobiales bacterium]MDP7117127.1 ABC transporter ATP-binding protein [Acidimicrobiales bacterium]MDP7410252.1 ABC transporter ATP-binding protein [Acidimicrobiales bacterium]MEE1571410.1 ABC transporter ATP-binding protein [Acidimicrobiales bacterium]|tara:strand:- start:13953 stop:15614 length:1662 start_codon:yes stop_codon:yes gene_type:complete